MSHLEFFCEYSLLKADVEYVEDTTFNALPDLGGNYNSQSVCCLASGGLP